MPTPTSSSVVRVFVSAGLKCSRVGQYGVGRADAGSSTEIIYLVYFGIHNAILVGVGLLTHLDLV